MDYDVGIGYYKPIINIENQVVTKLRDQGDATAEKIFSTNAQVINHYTIHLLLKNSTVYLLLLLPRKFGEL